jgi:hypothetical protein
MHDDVPGYGLWSRAILNFAVFKAEVAGGYLILAERQRSSM